MHNIIVYYVLSFFLFINTTYAQVETAADPAVGTTVEASALEKEILKAVNEERKKSNLPELKLNDKLMTIAREHSANMVAAGKAAHDLNGSNFDSRANKIDYKFNTLAENLAMVPRPKSSPEEASKEVVKAWMNSPMHRDNILRSDMTEAGIGDAKTSNGDTYYTMVFGNPKR